MAGTGTSHLRDGAVLRVEELVVEYGNRDGQRVQPVAGISLDVLPGETLGLVGESGCGKSTTGRASVQLVPAKAGRVVYDGCDLTGLGGRELRQVRPAIQMVFQDPISSLNPRHTIAQIVGEPLRVWRRGSPDERQRTVRDVLDAVGLDPDVVCSRRPHQFSGGQCQRISIARALVLEPSVVVCDEPVSALDVSVQAQILNLLEDMKERYGLTMVFIAHDLAVVKNVSDRIAVMYLGKLCEVADPETLYAEPAHHYTSTLISAIPVPDPQAPDPGRVSTDVDVPSLTDPPSGCRFRTRCPAATERCAREEPILTAVAPGHYVACHHPVVRRRTEPVPSR